MLALLSIKPEYAEKILKGEKLFEFRKVAFAQEVSKIFIYATSPVCRIVGEFEVGGIIKDSPKEIWERTKRDAGITKDFFFKYFKGRDKAVAIQIQSYKRYDIKINPYEKWDNFLPPQSFRYWDFIDSSPSSLKK